MNTIKFILVGGLLIVLPTVSLAQPPIQWEETFGGDDYDQGYEVRVISDGSIYVQGETSSMGAGGQDLYLLKLDPDGNLIWEQTYGGVNNEDVAMSIWQESENAIVIGGFSDSFSSSNDMFVVKTDLNGNELWSNHYGTDNSDHCRGIAETEDGGYILCGATATANNEDDLLVIKIDSLGNEEWSTQYGYSDHEYMYGIRQTTGGGYITAGWTRSLGSYDDGYLVKLDAEGNVVWDRNYPGNSWDYFFIVLETPAGGFIAAGYSDVYPGGPAQVWVVKTDADGNTIWNRYYGASDEDRAYALALSPNGYYIGAITQSTPSGLYDVWLIEIDEDGDIIWDATYGDDDHQVCYSLIPTENDGLLVGGYTSPGAGGSTCDVYVLCLEGSGPPELELVMTPLDPPIQIPASGGDFMYDIEFTNIGPTWCLFDAAIDVTTPSGLTIPILMRENINMMPGQTILRPNMVQTVPGSISAGTYTYHGYLWDQSSWTIYAEDSFTFEKLAGSDLGNSSNSWTLSGWDDGSPEKVEQIPDNHQLMSAYPNPFNPSTVISYQLQDANNTKLTIFDMQGREVTKLVDGYRNAGSHEVTFDGSGLASGIYFAGLSAGDLIQIKKLLLLK